MINIFLIMTYDNWLILMFAAYSDTSANVDVVDAALVAYVAYVVVGDGPALMIR